MSTTLKTKKAEKLALLKKEAQKFQKSLKSYPFKDISEYTRLIDQLEVFLAYGIWDMDTE